MRAVRSFVPLVLLAGCGGAKPQPAPAPAAPAPTPIAAPVAPKPDPAPPAGLRLPDTVTPLAYRVALELDPDQTVFHGRVEIDISVDAPSDAIWLNARDLTIRSAVARRNGAEIPLRAIPGTQAQHDALGLIPPATIQPGALTLVLDYDGPATADQSHGPHRNPQDGDWYVTTSHEPQGARRTVPCFDDPREKTPWTLELTVPAKDLALGNGPALDDTALPDGRHRVRFAATPPLPSYLFAFAVGPYETVDAGKTRHGVPMRIVVPHGHAAEAAYVAGAVGGVVATLEDYTAIPYPYAKLDLVVMPGSMGGAMENPGLVTFAPNLLLLPAAEEQTMRPAAVHAIAHELAHQWFGDLVTMAWWDDLWLNEGLASWAETWVTEATHPELGGVMYEASAREMSLGADAAAGARRIRQPITEDPDISAAFDGITYQKSSSVLRAFERWIGHDTFRDGIRRYLAAHAWKNATASDFLAAMNATAGKDVGAPLTTFLDQVGAPTIDMALDCPRGGTAALALTQRPYVARGVAAPRTPTRWQVPVCVRLVDEKTARCTLLSAETGRIELGTRCPTAIAPQADGVGHYRSALAPTLRAGTLAAWSRLNATEQFALAGDLSAQIASGEADARVGIELVRRLAASPSPYVAALGAVQIAEISRNLDEADRPALAKLVRSSYGARARRLGWLPRPGETADDSDLRAALLPYIVADGGDAALGAEAVALTTAWIADHARIPDPMWRAVLPAAVRANPARVFEPLRAAAATEAAPRARRAIYFALGTVRDPARLHAVLGDLLASPTISREQLFVLFGSDRPDTERARLDFLETNIDALLAKTPRDFQSWLAPYTCDPELRDRVVTLLRTRFEPLPDYGELALTRAIAGIDACITARAALAPQLHAALTGAK